MMVKPLLGHPVNWIGDVAFNYLSIAHLNGRVVVDITNFDTIGFCGDFIDIAGDGDAMKIGLYNHINILP
jgi:uncharacterized protein (DUF2252 family)